MSADLMTMKLRRAVILFAVAAVIVLPLLRSGEVQLVAVALIVALAAALHRAGPQRV